MNNLPKVATQWNSGATRDSNRGRRVLIFQVRLPLHHRATQYEASSDLDYNVFGRIIPTSGTELPAVCTKYVTKSASSSLADTVELKPLNTHVFFLF